MDNVTFNPKTSEAVLTMKGEATTSKDACATALKGSTYGIKTFAKKKADS